MMTFDERVRSLLKQTVPAISIGTVEENRLWMDLFPVIKELKDKDKTGNEINKFSAIYRWDRGNGFISVAKYCKEQPNTKMADPIVLFNDIVRVRKPNESNEYERCVLLLMDFGALSLESRPELARQLRNAIEVFMRLKSTFIFIGPRFNWTPEVEREIVALEYDLPNEDQIANIIDDLHSKVIAKYAKEIGDKTLFEDDTARFQSIKAARGLTITEVKRAVGFSIVSSGKIDPLLITEEKINAIKRSGLLEYIPTENYTLDRIGGLGRLKEYILKRRFCFTDEATNFGLETPRGLLFIGLPGSGKDLSAKAIGTALGIPTVKLDFGSILGGIVGESEARMDLVLRQITAISPCVAGDTIFYLPQTGSISAEDLYNKLYSLSKSELIRSNYNDTEVVLQSPISIRSYISGKLNDNVQLLSLVRRKTNRLVIIKTDDGRTVKVTPDHRILVKNNNIHQWKHAKYIQAGDELVTA